MSTIDYQYDIKLLQEQLQQYQQSSLVEIQQLKEEFRQTQSK